jgi:EAL domain-containing protein (putative c-di-GMP-specific phosphodiesterase class I)
MSENPVRKAGSDNATIGSPPLAPGAVPLCHVVDEEPSIRHFLSLVLHGSGIDTVEFAEGAALREAVAANPAPDLVFHDIPLDSTDAIESMVALAKCNFHGAVQLMSSRGAAVLEHVKGIGLEHKLNMLPVLKKPFETEAIVTIIRNLKLGTPPGAVARLGLDETLANNWIELWYQPKISLRKKCLAGAEAHIRVRHPQHGILEPNAFMPGARESSLATLAERALAGVLAAGKNLAKLGINLPVAVDIPLAALTRLPVEEIVGAHHREPDQWPGLIIDVPEEQIINELGLANEISARLEPFNVRLAIDQFGRGVSALSQLGALPFAELKIDRALVADRGSDKVNAPLCKTVIDLAHKFGRSAVALGIDKAADAVALVSMGCDYGQGFLLGQPMPEDRFISLLRLRAATQGRRLPVQP